MSIKEPVLSVIVPVYNAEKYLDACICSVLEQDYPHIELVLVNDGSKDGSGKIAESWQQKDERVKYLYHPNAGVSATRNEGLDAASGDYVMFVDADDRLRAGAVRAMVEKAESEQAELVLCGYNCVFADREELKTIEPVTLRTKEQVTAYFFEHFLEGISSSVWAKLYRREKLTGRFRTDLTMGEDQLFNLGYIREISSLCAMEDVFYDYDQTNVDSLVRRYKPFYYAQTRTVISEWLAWGASRGLEQADMSNAYYRLGSMYLTLLQYAAGKEKLSGAAQLCSEEADGLLDDAVLYAGSRFNVLHRLILKCVRSRYFRCAVLGMKAYSAVQKALKR